MVAPGVNSGTIDDVTSAVRSLTCGRRGPFEAESLSRDLVYECELRASVDWRRRGLAPLRGPNRGEEPLNFLLEVIALF
jgi:hypothetical protein